MDITQQVISLFTPQEWRAMLWLLVATLAATHTLKIAWRLSPWSGGGHWHVALVSAIVGFVLAYFLWPSGQWWVAGIIAGPASNVAFKLAFAVLKRYLPEFAAGLNADRRTTDMPIPPTGTPERRK